MRPLLLPLFALLVLVVLPALDLFVRREGRWQAVASHLSGIKQLP